MKIKKYPNDGRGKMDFGWLKANYMFSFSSWYNPEQVHFGALRVLNDDIIDPGMGFSTHPHDNMEIITVPWQGSLAHKDSTGGGGLIKKGDVQVMSAGSGLTHSEKNGSVTEQAHVFQIWIFPNEKDVSPRYEDKHFSVFEDWNRSALVASADGREESIRIHQNAFVSLHHYEAGQTLNYPVYSKGNGLFLFLIEGALDVNGTKMEARDGLGIEDFNELSIKTTENSSWIALEVPMAW